MLLRLTHAAFLELTHRNWTSGRAQWNRRDLQFHDGALGLNSSQIPVLLANERNRTNRNTGKTEGDGGRTCQHLHCQDVHAALSLAEEEPEPPEASLDLILAAQNCAIRKTSPRRHAPKDSGVETVRPKASVRRKL